MNESQTINSYRNSVNKLNKNVSFIPKRILNTESNIYTIRDNKTHTFRDFKPKKIIIRNSNNNMVSTYNNSMSHFNKNKIYNDYLLKKINNEKTLSLSCKKYKNFTYKDNNKNNSSRYNNKPKKIKLNIITNYFNPEETDRTLYSIQTIKKHKPKNNRINNNSTQVNKINPTNNDLCYYFPNLYNVPYNKIVAPDQNLNISKYFFKNLKDLNYNENLKNLSLIKKNKKVCLSESKCNNEKKPIFIEKVYTFDILKNLRFNFKNVIEKGKHKNFINSFYITRYLEFNNH